MARRRAPARHRRAHRRRARAVGAVRGPPHRRARRLRRPRPRAELRRRGHVADTPGHRDAARPRAAPAPGWHVDLPGPFEAAERVAKAYGIGRADAEEVAGLSRARARAARADGRATAETCPVPLGTTDITADEGAAADPHDGAPFVPRRRTAPAPGGSPAGAVHTARSTAPFADGAAGLLWASAESARRLGLRPLARVRAQVALGVDPAS
ncbi:MULTISPECIES: acetyl-CoA acetyltransferase [unclassified Streptomyces]|uniref:acetyl-CoA acetyltransferase n=1 Tax=Streptomyces sp. SID4926 TaxID=2690275 RepID=UPI0001FFFB63|nr:MULTISPECIES: acetyl-CoA acetyltransferase [unclassified Streptomyces]